MDEHQRRIVFSKGKGDWRTPPALFATLNNEFHFTIDVAADADNTLVPYSYITEEDDALSYDWGHPGVVAFCNPPYGAGLDRWVAHLHRQANRGATVVALLPSRTDRRFWHEHVMHAQEVRFIKGRVKFVLPDGTTPYTAPFPSAIVVWSSTPEWLPPRFRACTTEGRPVL